MFAGKTVTLRIDLNSARGNRVTTSSRFVVGGGEIPTLAKGKIAVLTASGGTTRTCALREILPSAAWMVVLPTLTGVASPEELMVTNALFEELQVTVLVRLWVLPSL